MSSPHSHQQYNFSGVHPNQPSVPIGSPVPNSSYPQGYRASIDPNHTHSLQGYVHAHHVNPPFIAELPASLPPTPPTSTPAQQLNEDELLAHRLQQMEVAEAQSTTKRASQYPVYPGASPHVISQPTSPYPTVRTYSPSVSSQSQFGTEYYASATQLQLSYYKTPADTAPEVVASSQPAYPVASKPGTEYHSPTSLTQHLSPADLAPEVVPPTRPDSYYAMPHKAPLSPSPGPPETSPTVPNSLSSYLEQHGQVPYPPQWVLPLVTESFYGSFIAAPKTYWLNTVDSQNWHPIRPRDDAREAITPGFRLWYKTSSSHRDSRFSWSMSYPKSVGKLHKQKHVWKYNLKMDTKSSMRVQETMTTPQGKEMLCTYVHASNYDSLRFLGPDGRAYRWVTSGPVSVLNGSRFDTLRHALFVSTRRYGNQDPLYGQIVADHAYWDGFGPYNELHEGVSCRGCNAEPIVGLRWTCKSCSDHNICATCRISNTSVDSACRTTPFHMPSEVLHIRSNTVDVELVVATLQVMKDWEKGIMREERRLDPARFAAMVETSRSGDLGRKTFWMSTDLD